MPVRIISKRSLYLYTLKNPNSSSALNAWASIVESKDWRSPLDIVETFGSKAVDILGKKDNKATTVPPERAVIDIKGNHIRVIVKYQFHPNLKTSCLYVKWIGTHAEYDKLCAKNLQYDVEQFK
jgi:mRNA interferase HigB